MHKKILKLFQLSAFVFCYDSVGHQILSCLPVSAMLFYSECIKTNYTMFGCLHKAHPLSLLRAHHITPTAWHERPPFLFHSGEPRTTLNQPVCLHEHIKGTQIYGKVFILDSYPRHHLINKQSLLVAKLYSLRCWFTMLWRIHLWFQFWSASVISHP